MFVKSAVTLSRKLMPSLLLSAQDSSSKEDSHANILSQRNLQYSETTKVPKLDTALGWQVLEQVCRYGWKGAHFLSKPKDEHGCCSANCTSYLCNLWLSSWGDMGIGRLPFQMPSLFLYERTLFCCWKNTCASAAMFCRAVLSMWAKACIMEVSWSMCWQSQITANHTRRWSEW